MLPIHKGSVFLCFRGLVIAGLAWLACGGHGHASQTDVATRVEWRFDNLQRVGGHALTVVGQPTVVQTDRGPAIRFDGVDDGIEIDANPLSGRQRFTIEVVFQAAADGPAEQRFVHFEEPKTENRALIELRMTPEGRWALDTFLRSPEPGLALIDRSLTHSSGEWHTARLSYDGKTMVAFVDGVRERSGDVPFTPLNGGRTSIGMRLNRVFWFKGIIHTVRILPEPTRVIALWPEGIPGGVKGGGDLHVADGRVSNVQTPTLTYVPPAGTPNGTAVIVCPGGSYARLAIANEGQGVAERLSPLGVATFILTYRLLEYGHPAPLQDVLRAIRVVRSRAPEFGVNPDRLGVMGASAGGHLAASAATLYDSPEGRTGHALDAVSARPDFVALLYPVITMTGPATHANSRASLLGPAPPPDLAKRLSLQNQVTPAMPPVFLVHTTADRSVPIENSLLFFAALNAAGVSAEMHLYERGEHGFGTRPDLGPTSAWVDRWFDWMRAHGWLPSPGTSTP